MRLKKLLSMTLLVMAMLGVGVSNVWADDITTLPFSKTWTTSDVESNVTSPFDAGTVKTGTNVTALNVNNTTATAWFDSDAGTDGRQAYALVTNEEVTISLIGYHGWLSGGTTQGVRLLNSGGYTLAEYIYNVGSCNLTDVKIGGSTASEFTAAYNCQSRYNSNKKCNGFTNQPYLTTAGWNPVFTFKIRYDGSVSLNVYFPNRLDGSINNTYTGTLPDGWAVDLQKIQAYANSNNDDRTLAINNLSITSEIAEKVNVTYKYEDTAGNSLSSIQADQVIIEEPGATVADIIPAYLKNTFYNGDESTKYVYSTYTSNSTTVNNDGSTVVTLKFSAKNKFNYSVKAVDGESADLKTNIVSGTCYDGETASFYLPSCVLVDGTLHFRTAEDSYKTQTVTSNNQVFSYEYATSTVDNVVFFVEGENISGASSAAASDNQKLASEGYMGRGSNLAVTTLPAGAYTVYVHYINTNASAQSLLVKAGDADVINATDVTVRPTKSGSVSLPESTAITLTAAGSSTSGVDYIYIVQTGVAAPISTYGKSTFSSTYPVDCANLPSGLKAYKATSCDGTTVRMEEVTSAVAGMTGSNKTGLVLVGTPSTTYYIPIAASGSEPSGNLLFGWNSSWGNFGVADSGTNFVLSVQSGNVVWAPVLSDKAPLATGQAGLWANVTISEARGLSMVFEDETTGINDVRSKMSDVRGDFFNLNGQRVEKPAKGLYIVNGKKVVLK